MPYQFSRQIAHIIQSCMIWGKGIKAVAMRLTTQVIRGSVA
jgi:hypothetical protein